MTNQSQLSDDIEQIIENISIPNSFLNMDGWTTESSAALEKTLIEAKSAIEELLIKARIDEQSRTGTFRYDDGTVVIRVFHPTEQYVSQDIRIAELEQQLTKNGDSDERN